MTSIIFYLFLIHKFIFSCDYFLILKYCDIEIDVDYVYFKYIHYLNFSFIYTSLSDILYLFPYYHGNGH